MSNNQPNSQSNNQSNNQVTNITKSLVQNISQQVIGKENKILLTLTCLVAGGHLLLEDLPGVGKTTLAKAVASSIKANFRRVQCTPDLMPSDITGITIYNQKSGEFEFIQGPVFTHVLLADEINRTSPRTQSALLEAMSDATVSIDNKTHTLPQPFFVIATQNPIEFSGTYDLPEAQMDRFMMRLSMGYPDANSTVQLLKTHSTINTQTPSIKPIISAEQVVTLRQMSEKITVSNEIYQYIVQLIEKTRSHQAVRLGASPRAAVSLLKACQAYALLTGSMSVTPTHIAKLAHPVLSHRLLFKNSHTSEQDKEQFFANLLNLNVRVPDNAQGNQNQVNELSLS